MRLIVEPTRRRPSDFEVCVREEEPMGESEVTTVILCSECDREVVRIVGDLEYLDEGGEVSALCAAHK